MFRINNKATIKFTIQESRWFLCSSPGLIFLKSTNLSNNFVILLTRDILLFLKSASVSNAHNSDNLMRIKNEFRGFKFNYFTFH